MSDDKDLVEAPKESTPEEPAASESAPPETTEEAAPATAEADAAPTAEPSAEPSAETSEAKSEPESEAAPSAPASSEDEPDLLADSPDDLGGDEPLPAANYAPAAPVVTRLQPARVDARGGTQVTLYGAGFVAGCRVLVGEEELISELVDAFTLRFVAPSGNGNAHVFVEAPSGKRNPEPGQLEFVEGPTIHRITPEEGPTEGGIEIVVEGRAFRANCTLSLFGVSAPDVVYESEERIRFTLPAAGDGPLEGAVVVTNLDGLMGRAENLFRYKPLHPRVDLIEPNHGWVNGGKLIAVKGNDFHPRARVELGGVPAPTTFRSPNQLDVEVPATSREPGTVDVVLLNPDGRRVVVEAGFRYEPIPAPPKIIDVIPRSGLTTGGAQVRITGDNFTDDVRVFFGELTAIRKVVSPKLIDVTLPARQGPGPVAIEVALGDVRIRVDDAFTYTSPNAPKVTSVEPRFGPTAGGTKVVLEGEGFPKNASVRFGGEAARTVLVKGPTRIEVTTPPTRTAGTVDVEVSSIETGPGVAVKGFRYEATAAPIITLVSPAKGTTDGNTELSIEGKNFIDGVVVLVNGKPAKTRKISGSVLEAFTPPGDDGKLVDVVVKNPDGQQAIQRRAFQYDARYRS
ncbi:MAG: IPT/TIG domain-containing protein [Polyangiaceae bacterium]